MYIQYAANATDTADAFWLGRQGIAMALHSAADVLRTKDLPVVMTFLISRALVRIQIFVKRWFFNLMLLISDKNNVALTLLW